MTSTNELGAQVVFDGGLPRIFTGVAREAISGASFVVFSGAGVGVVGSDANTFTASDMQIALASAANQINGIAIQDVASGADVGVATRGAYLVKCAGSVLEGTLVEAVGATAVRSLTSGTVPTGLYAAVPGAKHIGRALTAGASGTANYALVDFKF